jgi:fibronectin type 3 domain-containing protein
MSATTLLAATHSVTLKWTDADSTAKFNVYRATASGSYSGTPVNAQPVTGLQFVDTTVTPGAVLFYVVKTIDTVSGLQSIASNEVKAIVPTDSGTVDPPVVTGHNVALTWKAPPIGTITGYNVYRGTASGVYTTPLNATPVTGLAYTDTTALAGKSYFYIVKAISNGVESAASNEVKASIGPDAPTGLTCTVDGVPCS